MHRGVILGLALVFVAGCPPPPRMPLDPIPLHQAIDVVNANTGRITTCLKATGSASGHVVLETGKRQAFDFHASVQVLAPRHMYASFKSGLGTQEMLLGSNDRAYWLHLLRDDDTYRVGTYQALEDDAESPMQLRPDMLIEALGFNALPETTVGTAGPIQRVVDEYQQLIFLAYTSKGQGIISKEYWLDRYEPRLIRRIMFRDDSGRVVMDSRLDDYRALGDGGALLPSRVRVEWPVSDAVFDFRIREWKPMPDRGRDHSAFIAPHRRGQTYSHMIDLDTGLPLQ
jgi:hypothetical protein